VFGNEYLTCDNLACDVQDLKGARSRCLK